MSPTSKDTIFPMSGEHQQQQQQHHFNDYGFQTIWWEARKSARSGVQSCKIKERFKLQKPTISKEGKSKKRGHKWWKGILQFWKWRRSGSKEDRHRYHRSHHVERTGDASSSLHGLGPVYFAESSISRGPWRRKAVVNGGRPISGTAKMVDLPYFNMRELNSMDVERPISGSYASSSPFPVYLVT